MTDPAIKVTDDTRYPKPVSLTFDVEEGQQFTVADVIWHWKGTSGISDEQLWPLTSVRPGDFFDTSKVRETIDGLRRLYSSQGYSEVAIVPEVKVVQIKSELILASKTSADPSRSEMQSPLGL